MKRLLKALAEAAAAVVVLPAVALYWLHAALAGAGRAFPGWSQAFALLPGLVGVYLRRAFYRRTAARCAEGASLSFGTVLSHPGTELGRHAFVGMYCVLGDVTLGDDVLVASHVSIVNGGQQHGIERLDVPVREQPGRWPRITIGEDSWIGERAVVLADVGRHCVVGAGAVVNRPLPDYAIAVGVPARIIRYRNEPLQTDGSLYVRNRRRTVS